MDTHSMNLDCRLMVDDPGRWNWNEYTPKKYGVVHFNPRLLDAYVWSLQLTQSDVYGRLLQAKIASEKLRVLPVSARQYFHRNQEWIPEALRPFDLFYWAELLPEVGRAWFVPGSHWNVAKERWEEIDLPIEGSGWGSNSRALVLHPLF